jgi:hypothetical protein
MIKVTVGILGPPIVYIVPEIVEQGLRRREGVWNFILANVLVIAFASLVVVPQYRPSIHNEGKSIFEVVSASRNWRRQTPYHQFHVSLF